jgi:hypothetical protein
VDINFSPKSAKEYNFTVICKSLVNRFENNLMNKNRNTKFFKKKGILLLIVQGLVFIRH